MSRDGCDSRCEIEDAAWSVIPIAPVNMDGRWTAYDPVRRRLVVVGLRGEVWEWDGKRWTETKYSSEFTPSAVFYNPDRQQVEMVGSEQFAPVQLYAWSHGQWTQLSTGDGPASGWTIAAYDDVLHRWLALEINVLDAGTTWANDATGAWSQLPGTAEIEDTAVAAFDSGSGQMVVEMMNVEWVYDGNEWSSSSTSFASSGAIAFDPARGHLVFVGGPIDEAPTMYERHGGQWQTVANASVPCIARSAFSGGAPLAMPLYYDPASATLELVVNDFSKICSWDGSWTASVPPVPIGLVGVVYDPATRGFVYLASAVRDRPDAPTEVWTATDVGWHRIETLDAAPAGIVTDIDHAGPLAVYSPGRAATVLYRGADPGCTVPCGSQNDTWSFDGTGWASIAPPVPALSSDDSLAATYDPVHGRIVLAIGSPETGGELWSLPDAGQAWVPLEIEPLENGLRPNVTALAWNARAGSFMALLLSSDFVYEPFELRDHHWVEMDFFPAVFNISGIDSNVLLSVPRSGGVVAMDTYNGPAWEYAGTDWIRLPSVPVRLYYLKAPAYNPVDGSMLIAGFDESGVVAAMFTRTSLTPLESCNATADIDGDGLAGCDDPDCYWACSRGPPSISHQATCP
jgi:hypothetical protein